MKRVKLYLMLSVAAALLIQLSCSPRLELSQLTPPSGWEFSDELQRDTIELAPEWWHRFQDTTLNNLIDRALLKNRDLAAAAARVESSRSEVKVARSAYLPSLSMDLTGDWTRTQWDGRVNEYYVEPTISWELPLFGALRSVNRKAKAEAMASLWALRGVELSVVCEVATTYFNLREAEASYEIARRSCDLRRESAALIDSMAKYGMSSGVDLEQARSLVYSAEADIALYYRERNTLMLSLSLLLGEMPSRELVESRGSNDLLICNIPIDAPALLPSQLLNRRWDVQQSFQQMELSAAAVGIARAARYPTISLTAAVGVAGETIKSLTSSDPWSWSIATTLSEPLYNFGGLKHSELAAKSEYIAALNEYEQTMLQAISEVEQSMVSLRSYTRERASQEMLVRANSEIRQSVGALYANGLEDYLNVIDAERSLYASQQSLVESITSQRLSYVNLCKALGGGF